MTSGGSVARSSAISSWLSGFTRTAVTVWPGTNLGRTVIGTDCRHEAVYTGTLSSATSTVNTHTGRENASSPPVLTLVCWTSVSVPRPSSPFLSRSLSTDPVIDLNFLNMPMTRSLPRGQFSLLFRRGQETTDPRALA